MEEAYDGIPRTVRMEPPEGREAVERATRTEA